MQHSHSFQGPVTGGNNDSVLLSQPPPPLPEAEVRYTIESIGDRRLLRHEGGIGL